MQTFRYTGIVSGLLLLIIVTGCSLTQPLPEATPTLIPVTDLPTTTATASPSPSPQPSPTAAPPTDTPTALVQASDTPQPPTNTPLPTDTPGPFEHTIQADETLGFIVQQYGHRSFDVIAEVVRINENVINADLLPLPGTTILIPRPTVAASVPSDTTPADNNPDAITTNNDTLPTQAAGLLTTSHVVQDGESLIDIAQQYNTTLEIISQLNPDIGFFGCNFNIPSGGPDCIIILQVGQEVTIPAPTPTPTLSPTPSGNETATPTPTYTAPMVVFPPNGGVAQAGVFSLQWISTEVLLPDEVYLVYIKDVTLDSAVNAFITRSTSFDLPPDLIPRSGQRHEFQWWITVGKQNSSGVYEDVSSTARVNTFYWESAN